MLCIIYYLKKFFSSFQRHAGFRWSVIGSFTLLRFCNFTFNWVVLFRYFYFMFLRLIIYFSGFNLNSFCFIHIPNPLFFLSFLFLSLPPRQRFPPWECDRSNSFLYTVSHLHEGTGKLRKTCANKVGYLTESVSNLQFLKNDLSLNVSMCRPQTGGQPSKYWPGVKLLNLVITE